MASLRIDELKNIVTKTGKNMLFVKSNGVSYSCFPNATTANWRVGMMIDVETKRVDKDGKTYWNIEFPRTGGQAQSSATIDQLKRIETKLDQLILIATNSKETEPATQEVPYDDTPFPDVP